MNEPLKRRDIFSSMTNKKWMHFSDALWIRKVVISIGEYGSGVTKRSGVAYVDIQDLRPVLTDLALTGRVSTTYENRSFQSYGGTDKGGDGVVSRVFQITDRLEDQALNNPAIQISITTGPGKKDGRTGAIMPVSLKDGEMLSMFISKEQARQLGAETLAVISFWDSQGQPSKPDDRKGPLPLLSWEAAHEAEEPALDEPHSDVYDQYTDITAPQPDKKHLDLVVTARDQDIIDQMIAWEEASPMWTRKNIEFTTEAMFGVKPEDMDAAEKRDFMALLRMPVAGARAALERRPVTDEDMESKPSGKDLQSAHIHGLRAYGEEAWADSKKEIVMYLTGGRSDSSSDFCTREFLAFKSVLAELNKNKNMIQA